MRLSRREAVLGLALCGLGAGLSRGTYDRSNNLADTLRAVAEVVTPAVVDIDQVFVTEYVLGRARVDLEYERRVAAMADFLDEEARRQFSRPFAALNPARRSSVLRSLGVYSSHSDPNGTLAQSIRYFVVNDLLYVLYSRPECGRAVGVENPPGYAGGRAAYQRGPGQ